MMTNRTTPTIAMVDTAGSGSAGALLNRGGNFLHSLSSGAGTQHRSRGPDAVTHAY